MSSSWAPIGYASCVMLMIIFRLWVKGILISVVVIWSAQSSTDLVFWFTGFILLVST